MGTQEFYLLAESISKFLNWRTKGLQCRSIGGDPLLVDNLFNVNLIKVSEQLLFQRFDLRTGITFTQVASRMWRITYYLRQTVVVRW